MKSLVAGFAALLATLALLPDTATAGPLAFIGRCPSCGVPMYGQTVLAGYDRWGQPIVQTIPVGHACARGHHDRDRHRGSCGSSGYGGYGSSGYGGYGYGGYGYGSGSYGYSGGYGRSGCDSRPRTGFSISIFR